MNGELEWVEDQLENPVALDVILYLRLERSISHPVSLASPSIRLPTNSWPARRTRGPSPPGDRDIQIPRQAVLIMHEQNAIVSA